MEWSREASSGNSAWRGLLFALKQDEFAADAQLHAARRISAGRNRPGCHPQGAAFAGQGIVALAHAFAGQVDPLGKIQALIDGIGLFAVVAHGYPFYPLAACVVHGATAMYARQLSSDSAGAKKATAWVAMVLPVTKLIFGLGAWFGCRHGNRVAGRKAFLQRFIERFFRVAFPRRGG